MLYIHITKASCQAWLKLLFANEVRIGGPGGGCFKTDHFEAIPQLNRVASVVDFEADVPGGNWVTVGFDSPPVRKLRCRKSARCCGAKHISKSKCAKHTILGPLLEVEMSKKCTLLWREARFEVKMLKTLGVRTTFGGSDVVSRGRRKGLCTLSKVSKTWGFCSIFNYNHHYTTLHSNTLHYTTATTTPSLHCAPLHYTALTYTQLHYTQLHYTTLHYTTFHYTSLHYTTLHSTPLHYNYNYTTTQLHSTTLQLQLHNYTLLHSTTLNYTTLHYITLHYTTFHYTPLHYTTWHYTTLHWMTLHHR